MNYKRLLSLPDKGSAFLFGPRMTGKTFLLRSVPCQYFLDLLDPENQLEAARTPRAFWERINNLEPGSLVIVDEIQRVPPLLDYVQKGMEERRLRFLLSGSSARKLRRGGANLLGGRAADLRLHPLTALEMGEGFKLSQALNYGTLPRSASLLEEGDLGGLRQFLRSYVTTYVKEEIQAEALIRNIGAFQRFLSVAAQSNGEIIEFSNISRECAVPASTVKEYFSILEDTLLAEFLWPWDRSERKKARPKFHFFDPGLVRSLQNRLTDPPTPMEEGTLFESWFFRELVRLRDYEEKDHTFSFWREGSHEIDLLVSGGRGPLCAFECKRSVEDISAGTLAAFRQRFPKIPVIMVAARETYPRRLPSGLEALPWAQALERYRSI